MIALCLALAFGVFVAAMLAQNQIHGPNLQDAALTQSKALPASDGSVYTTGIDTGDTATTGSPTGAVLEINAPALTVTQLPNSGTATYKVQHSTALASGYADVNGLEQVCKQTGASSAGAAAENVRIPLPEGLNRYIRLAVTTASAGNCSAATAYFSVKV